MVAIHPFPIGIPAEVTLNDVRSRAKVLLKSIEAGAASELERIEPYFDDPSSLTLQQTQLVIAREYGFSSWRKLKAFLEVRDELHAFQRQEARDLMSVDPGGVGGKTGRLTRQLAAEMGRECEQDGGRCSFCFSSQYKVAKLIVGTGYYICGDCVELCLNLINEGSARPAADGDEDLRCSFCSKLTTKIVNLVSATGARICNECLELCVEIISEGPGSNGDNPRPPASSSEVIGMMNPGVKRVIGILAIAVVVLGFLLMVWGGSAV